jgi:HK97 family phage major capsid protein
MSNDANVFKNSLTGAGYVTPKEWSNEIEQVAREKNIFRGLTNSIMVVNRFGQPGNTFYVQKNVALSAAAVTDGDAVSISAIDFSQISVTASISGVATQITLKQLRDQLSTVREDVIMNLGTALGEKEERDIITELYTTTSTTIYSGSKTASTVTVTDTFGVSLLIAGRKSMRIAKRNPLNLVIHPAQESVLINDQKFLDASYLGSTSVNREGFIGRYLGIDVFVSTNIGSFTGGSNADLTVYRALLLGPRAAVLLDKAPATVDIDRNLIQDLSVTMVAYKDYGVQILNEESIRILASA